VRGAMAKKALVGKRKRGHIVRRERLREAQVVEGVKRVLLVRGTRCGPHGLPLLRDVKRVKNPDDAMLFSRKNGDVRPFESEGTVELFCNKNDCGLFSVVSHSKKRPNNLVLGRIYDSRLLDMVELNVTDYVSLETMLARGHLTKQLGSQTCVLFQGDEFESSLVMLTLKSLLLDLLRAPPSEQVDLSAVDHLVVCSAAGGKVYIRNYVVAFRGKDEHRAQSAHDAPREDKLTAVQVDGVKIPDLALLDMGPSMDLVVRRSRLAPPDLLKLALRQPKAPGAVAKVKNVSHDKMDGKLGRVHMQKQDLSKLVTRSRFNNAGLKRSFNKGKEAE
jgi:ribosome production factor 2